MAGKKKGLKKPTGGVRPASLPRAVSEQVEQAEQMLNRKQFVHAELLLRELDRRFPNNLTILQLLGELSRETDDTELFLDVAERSIALTPNDPDYQAQRAYAHLKMGLPFLAQRYFHQVIEHYPTHPKAESIRKLLSDLQPAYAKSTEQMAQAGFALADIPELSARHEQVQVWLSRKKYAEARRVAAGIVSRWPTFAAAWNNTAEAWFREGNPAQAVAATRQALAVMPDNVHAGSNLARFLFLDGKIAEARELAARLLEMPIQHPDNRLKKAESLGLLGDDLGVLRVWGEAEQEGFRLAHHHLAWLHHIAAVSAYSLGDETRARQLWAKCLNADPHFHLAKVCIEDLDRPVGEQSGPWFASLDMWLPQAAATELIPRVSAVAPATIHLSLRDDLRRLLQKYPSTVPMVPYILNRSDERSRNAIVRLCGGARTPELLEVLRDFALSQRGTDYQRIQAAFIVAGAGLLPGGEARMWLKGEWKQPQFPTMEITGERTGEKLPPRLEALMAQSSEASHKGDLSRSEELARQVAQEQPDHFAVQYNLASVLRNLGRHEEARTIMRQIRQKHPDYLFAAVDEVRELIREGELDRAEEILTPLFARPRMHFTDFRVLAVARIELAQVRRDNEAARWWVPLLEAIDPSDPNLPIIRKQLGMR